MGTNAEEVLIRERFQTVFVILSSFELLKIYPPPSLLLSRQYYEIIQPSEIQVNLPRRVRAYVTA